jgi:hypothetical protein
MDGIDREALPRLAKALAFVCGETHPAAQALRQAAASGTEADLKKARAAFLKLKTGQRQAAYSMLQD